MVRKVSEILAEEAAKGGTPSPTAKPVRKVAEIAAEEEAGKPQGFMGKVGQAAMDYGVKPALDLAGFVGTQLDRVSPVMGAPMRNAIGAVQKSREERGGRAEGLGMFLDPEEYKDLGRFASTFASTYGEDPEKAPSPGENFAGYGVPLTTASEVLPSFYSETGEGMALKKGGLFDPSAAGAAGFAAQMVSPVGIGAGGMKAVGPVANMAGRTGVKAAETVAKVADAATGTKLASKTVDAGKTLGNSIKETTQGLAGMLDSKQAPDFEQLVGTAQKNGIDLNLLPSSVEFGPTSVISRSDRVKAEGPIGQKLLDDHAKGLGQVQDAVRRDIEKVGGGAPRTRVEAGEVLRDGFNAGVERAFDGVATSHNEILKAAPGIRLSKDQIGKLAPKLQEYEAWAKKKLDLGSTKAAKEQGRQILRAVESIRKSGESYEGALGALREIGSVAFKASNTAADVAPDIAKYRKLYGDLSEAMIGTVEETFDAGTARSLRESNAAMSKIFGDKSLLGEIGEKATSTEELFKSIIEHGDSKRLAALKEYLTPEQMQTLKGTFLNELIKQTHDGGFTFRSLFNNLRQKKDLAGILFEPGEIDNFQHLMHLGERFGSPVMSQSGTGASNAFMDFFRTARDRGTDALLTDPIKKKARAVGFDLEEFSGKAAAKNPGRPPTMSMLPGAKTLSSLPSFRGRAARAYSTQEDEEE